VTDFCRRSVLASIGAVASIGVCGCISDGSTTFHDAPMMQYDAGNTGYHPATTGPTGDLTVEWRHESGVPRSLNTSQPVVADGTLYYMAGGLGPRSPLFAVDAETGEQQWTSEPGGYQMKTPAVWNDLVVVPIDGTLYGLSVDDGSARWSIQLADGGYSPTVANGVAYVITYDGGIHAIDLTDGTEQWYVEPRDEFYEQGPNDHRVKRGPFSTVAEGLVICNSGSDELVARDTADGSVAWRTSPSPSGPVTAVDARLFGIDYDSVWTWEIATGDSRQRTTIDTPHQGGSVSNPRGVAVDDETVYVGGTDGGFSAIDRDGHVRWSVQLLDGQLASAPVVVDGVVYVRWNMPMEPVAKLFGITANGDVVLDYNIQGIASQPVVLNGCLYTGVTEDPQRGARMTAFAAE